jgi:hypothetical protein
VNLWEFKRYLQNKMLFFKMIPKKCGYCDLVEGDCCNKTNSIKIEIQGHFPEFLHRFTRNIILKRNYLFSGKSNINSLFQECRLLKCEINVTTKTEPRQNFE